MAATGRKQQDISAYSYVDTRYTEKSGRQSPWQRMSRDALAKWQMEQAVNFNCFATVQTYANHEKTNGEAYIAPLYFDLDFKSDPSVAQADAIKLIDFFTNELDVKETDVWLYFSGSKGFHILINSQAIGVTPRNDIHKIYKHIAAYLIHRLEMRSMDLAVYTSYRMLRLPNSIHQSTNLYKIALTFAEIRTMSLAEIQVMAQEPRRHGILSREDREEALDLREKMSHFFEDKKKEYEEALATASTRYDKEEFHFTKGQPPVCVIDIMENGWKQDGQRNQATVQLASYYKAAGYTKLETSNILVDWVTQHTSAGSGYQLQQRVANTRGVVDSVFSEDNNYRFACAFIRSLHGAKKPGQDYERVACAGESLCHCIKKNKGDESKAINLHLSQTGDAGLAGQLVTTDVMVAGMKHTPYMVPSRVEYHCWGREGCKKTHCPLYDIPSHTLFKDLGVQDPELIQFTGTAGDNIKGILREISGIPNCSKYNVDVVDQTNVEELMVIPYVEVNKSGEAGQQMEDKKSRYVLRKVYTIGGLPISENKYYKLHGYVVPHPKNQEATIMVKKAEPLQDVVTSFELTDEVKELLTIFHPADYEPESIWEKISAICDDLTYNVTRIVERDETLLGVLLTYMSVLRISVPWDTLPIRGWVELKIVGDTGTGKSALIEKMMNFAGLGTRVNAESTSRTGLTYKMEQTGGTNGAWFIVWGAWPLADRELIWIDEATGIPKEQYGEMTLARSEGKLEVKRAVTAETPCRVRAIMSGNVPKGRRLADYGQGVEALKDIFNNEDIRRFDFGIFMRSSDVDPDLYNQELPTYPKLITSEAFTSNILFAWSRKPDEILFPDATIDAIRDAATELSRLYGKATDVPLVSPSDQRNKLARLTVALAALTHSVDESGERIVVYPGHVEVITQYLKDIYNAPGCGLNYYARLSVKEVEMTDDLYTKLTDALKTIDILKGEYKFYEFVTLFARQRYMHLNDIESMLAVDKDDVKLIINKLVRLHMIEKSTGGYKKKARFNAYIQHCFKLGIFDNIEDEDDF